MPCNAKVLVDFPLRPSQGESTPCCYGGLYAKPGKNLKMGFMTAIVGVRELLEFCSDGARSAQALHKGEALGLFRALVPHSRLGIPASWTFS